MEVHIGESDEFPCEFGCQEQTKSQLRTDGIGVEKRREGEEQSGKEERRGEERIQFFSCCFFFLLVFISR